MIRWVSRRLFVLEVLVSEVSPESRLWVGGHVAAARWFVAAVLLLVSWVTAAPVPLVWEPLYEPGQGGATVAVAVSPHDPSLIISAGDMLGVARSTDAGERWQSTFGLRGYEMCDITFHPSDPKVVWVGSASGPYVSSDAGTNWQLRRKGMPAVRGDRYSAIVEKVVFDPSTPGRLLAFGGTSRRWAESDTFGWVWESTDDGKSWAHIATVRGEGSTEPGSDGFAGKGANIVAAGFNADGSRLFVLAAGQGVLWSDDGGRTFRRGGSGMRHSNVQRLAFHPRDPGTLFVSLGAHKPDGEALFTPGGIYKSIDGGASWIDITANLPQDATDRDVFTAHYNTIAVSASNPDVLWTNDGRWNTGVIYRSVDGGKSWSPVATKQNIGHAEDSPERKSLLGAAGVETATNGGCAVLLTADPSNENVCYGFGSEYLLRTVDGGKSWQDITAYRPDPSKPDEWRGRGWTGWCATNIAFNPYRPGQAIVQAMDSGRAWISDNNFATFRYPAREPHPWLGGNDAAFTRDGRVYITTGHFGQFNGILRSRDGGKTFETLAGQARGLPDAGFISGPEGAGVYAHPDDSRLVWAALGGVLMHSTDGGDTWTGFAPDRGWRWLAGDPTRPGRFYASSREGVHVVTDGSEPVLIGGPSPAGGGRLNVDASGRVVACQWRDGRTGVWRYDPRSAQWTRLLDEHYAYRCATDPANPSRMLLVTADDPYHDFAVGNGVWVSSDDGKSWAPASNGLPMTRARAAAFDPFDPSRVVIGTYGRGFFTATWPVGHRPIPVRSYSSTPEDASQVARPATGPATRPTDGRIHVIQRFNNNANFAYTYGADWKLGGNVTPSANAVRIDSTEHGGAGIVLNGANLAPGRETLLVVRLRTLEGNEAAALAINILRGDGNVGLSVPLGSPTDSFQTLSVPLAGADVEKVLQVQIQGTNFSPSARRLRVEIELIGTRRSATTAPAGAEPASDAADPEAQPAPKGLPSTPAWGFWPDHPRAWMGMFRGQLERTRQGDIDLVFVGDSLTQDWSGSGKQVWDAEFAGRKAVNYGIGGDSTRQVLYRIGNGLLDNIKPRVVVLLIGTNNLYDDINSGSDTEIAAGIAKTVELIRTRLPSARILVLGILPRQNDYFCNRIAAINTQVSGHARTPGVRYLDLTSGFLLAPGKVKPELYTADQLHLSTAGYKLLADMIRPSIEELLRSP
jgi:lysophospholipase L1-like esterase